MITSRKGTPQFWSINWWSENLPAESNHTQRRQYIEFYSNGLESCTSPSKHNQINYEKAILSTNNSIFFFKALQVQTRVMQTHKEYLMHYLTITLL